MAASIGCHVAQFSVVVLYIATAKCSPRGLDYLINHSMSQYHGLAKQLMCNLVADSLCGYHSD